MSEIKRDSSYEQKIANVIQVYKWLHWCSKCGTKVEKNLGEGTLKDGWG